MRVREEGELAGEASLQERRDEDTATVEERLEALADDVAAVIEEAVPEDREALHDYAVSLVRERLPVAADLIHRGAGATGADADRTGEVGRSDVQAFGYGMLLMPVGFCLIWIFPFIGVMLFGVGAVMMAWGLTVSLFGNLRNR